MRQYKCVVMGKTFDGDGAPVAEVILANGMKAQVRLYVKTGNTFVNEDISPDGAEKIKKALDGVFAPAGK